MPDILTADGLITASEVAVVTADEFAHASFVCGQAGLCPESSYFLDCSTEILDLTPDVSAWVRDRFDLDGYLDDYRWDGGANRHSDRLHDCSRGIRQHYLDGVANCTVEQQTHYGMALLFGIKQQFCEFHWSVSDGCAAYALREGFDNIGTPADIRARIAASARLTDWVGDVRTGLSALRQRYERCDRQRLLQQMQNRINRVETAIARMPGYVAPAKRIDRRIAKQVRQAVKKSSALFVRTIGAEQLREFLADRPFVLEGRLFNYRVEKTTSVIIHTARPTGGHIPYRLAVIDNTNGRHVADACLYFERTPILDQIVALSMFIKSDEEQHLLSSANFFNRSNDFALNATMKDLGKVTSADERRQQLSGDFRVTGELTVEERTQALDQIILHLDEMADDDRIDNRVRRSGVTHQQFREEIVPWRARLRESIIDVLSEEVGLTSHQMRRVIGGDDNIDRLVFSRKLPPTLDGFIDCHFTRLLT